MGSVVLTIPDEIRDELKRFSWIKWSELAREEALKKDEQLERWTKVEKIVAKSQLTQEQADRLSDEINLAVAKRYEKLAKGMK